MNVLVVDDNETNLKLLRAIFTSEGMNVFEAADGLQALMMLKSEKIDVVVSDILMPNMDGYHLCFEVRKSEQFKDIGLILYTATDFTPTDEKRAYEVGADNFLKKHGPIQEILTAVHDAAQLSNQGLRKPVKLTDEFPELQVMKAYSAAMIRKLEEKNIELDRAHEELKKANEVLEERVRERTSALEIANKELEAFSYSVSHDLLAPLRWIDGYSEILSKECGTQLSAPAANALQNIQKARHRMTQLINDLLGLARINRWEISRAKVNLSALAEDVIRKLAQSDPDRKIEFEIEQGITVLGDDRLLRIIFENLLGNAWKYSSKNAQAQIEFGSKQLDDGIVYFVRDNGAGFDMKYSGKLFNAFQRLHPDSEFPGNGIGLATVQRIIHRHGGKIWAESVPGQGARFYFTL